MTSKRTLGLTLFTSILPVIKNGLFLKMTKWWLVLKMLNLILSTTGSDIHIDVLCWSQILQRVVMKFIHGHLFCVKITI